MFVSHTKSLISLSLTLLLTGCILDGDELTDNSKDGDDTGEIQSDFHRPSFSPTIDGIPVSDRVGSNLIIPNSSLTFEKPDDDVDNSFRPLVSEWNEGDLNWTSNARQSALSDGSQYARQYYTLQNGNWNGPVNTNDAILFETNEDTILETYMGATYSWEVLDKDGDKLRNEYIAIIGALYQQDWRYWAEDEQFENTESRSFDIKKNLEQERYIIEDNANYLAGVVYHQFSAIQPNFFPIPGYEQQNIDYVGQYNGLPVLISTFDQLAYFVQVASLSDLLSGFSSQIIVAFSPVEVDGKIIYQFDENSNLNLLLQLPNNVRLFFTELEIDNQSNFYFGKHYLTDEDLAPVEKVLNDTAADEVKQLFREWRLDQQDD